MKKEKLIKNDIVLLESIIFLFIYLVLLFLPLIIIYLFFNNSFEVGLFGYLSGIIYHLFLFNKKNNKKIFVNNYFLDFEDYFDKDKKREVNLFFENYLK